MVIRSRLFALGGGLAVLTFSVVAVAKLSKTGTGASAGFHVSGPAGMSVDGKTSDVDIADDGTTLTVTVKLATVDTGIDLRNANTRNALEVGSFPTATLKVARSSIKFPAAGAESSGDAKGSLKIHGTTRDVTFHYTAKLDRDTYAVKGTATTSMTDFGIKPPVYLGVAVKPEIGINVSFSAKDY